MQISEKGSYVLLIRMTAKKEVAVGILGPFTFQPGYYLYIGSALGGLNGRIKRHLRETKKTHWHIDYLLRYARILEVWWSLSEDRQECVLAQAARGLPEASVPLMGFGSSDCRCPSHLVYIPKRPQLAMLQSLCGDTIILKKLSMTDIK